RIPPIWWILVLEVLVRWPGPPVELTGQDVSIALDIRQIAPRLASLAESKTEEIFLELDNVEAERSPGAAWDVYLGLPANAAPNPESPFLVGTVSLFSAGIRAHAHGKFSPEHFTFRANRAIAAALQTNKEQLRLTFVPAGPLIDGKPSRPKVQSPVRIGTINIAVGKNQQQRQGYGSERPYTEPKPK